MAINRRRIAGLAGWVILMTAWPGETDAAPNELDGTWAGDQLRLVVHLGQGQIEAGCATAALHEPLRLDQQRRFLVAGTWQVHRGGPDKEGQSAARGARFEGTLAGNDLILTVRPDNGDPPQRFQLRRGATIKILRCLAG